MKKLVILSFLLVQLTFTSYGQSEKYQAAMQAAYAEMEKAKTPEENLAVANKFERIANAEKTQWLPYYHAAILKANIAFGAKDKDAAADEVEALINKADTLEKDNAEIYCLKSMVSYIRMMVDPQARWMQYGAEATKNIERAKKLDPTNPRPIMLEANSKMNTPEAFGGGCKVAKPIAEKALQLQENFKPISSIHPNWGKDMMLDIINKCNK
jgi:hypothetical protein